VQHPLLGGITRNFHFESRNIFKMGNKPSTKKIEYKGPSNEWSSLFEFAEWKIKAMIILDRAHAHNTSLLAQIDTLSTENVQFSERFSERFSEQCSKRSVLNIGRFIERCQNNLKNL